MKIVYWRVPYVRQQYAAFRRYLKIICSRLPPTVRIQPIYIPSNTSALLPNKDAVAKHLASSIVYQYQCEHCHKCYIGETVRHMCTRVKEHINGKPEVTEVNQHQHQSTAQQFTILCRTKFTKVAEALYIKKKRQTLSLLNVHNRSLPLYLF